MDNTPLSKPKLVHTFFNILLSVFFLTILSTQTHAAKEELTLLIWSDYLDPELISKFEAEKNVTVKQNYFVSDDDRDDILQDSNAEGFDIVLVNGANLNSYIKRGWITPIPADKITNRRHIGPQFEELFPESKNFAVPYFWGTLGIAYRTDLVSKPITSWKDLYHPPQEMHQKIAMLGSARDLVGMALKAHNYSINSESKEELKTAEKLIQQQAPFVKSYNYISLQKESGLVTGDIVAAMIFSGDALTLQQFNENIRYVVPEEGGNVWVDFMAILSLSSHKPLAMDFIDFMNEPKHAARQAEYVYFPSPNKAAEQYLPAEFLQNTEIYPSKATLDKSESYRPISPRAMKKRHEIFSRVSGK